MLILGKAKKRPFLFERGAAISDISSYGLVETFVMAKPMS